MHRPDAALDPALEQNRLDECAREPIRVPGRIQSHGWLFGIDTATDTVTIASENASEWLGRSVDEFESVTLAEAVRDANPVDPVRITLGAQEYESIVHRLEGMTVVELEPVLPNLGYARTSVVSALQRLSKLTTADELRAAAVEEVRAICGFDRVLMYQFHEDGHGEVVAESQSGDLEPYLGLHFPASDIPAQARDLYITKLSRAIVRSDDDGVPLVSLDGAAASIDLSVAELRAVSPFHRQFMRNMGQVSTLSLSMVDGDRLHAMITCAHGTERRLPVLLRRALEVLAAQVSLQLVSIERIRQLTHDLRIREERSALLAPLFASEDVASALLDGDRTVLDLVPSDGVVLRINGLVHTSGEVPPPEDVRQLLELTGATPLISQALPANHPQLAAHADGFAGLLVVPMKSDGDTLVFLRREITRVVNWLGDPRSKNRESPLSPRVSFSAWRESVTGTSLPWARVAEEARDLGRELEGALLRRAEVALAGLAMRDALTGLHNRRSLLERLDPQPEGSRALLFVDIDRFKSINDTLGHDAGDRVIIEVAKRLVASSRAQDLVVRLGGDEFVVLCESQGLDDARPIADRIVAAVSEPIQLEGGAVTVTASVGIVTAEPGMSGTSLLEAADRAMYRAKKDGRNRVSA